MIYLRSLSGHMRESKEIYVSPGMKKLLDKVKKKKNKKNKK